MTEERRAETGVMQFGDDWPGVFIRGDNAKMFVIALEEARSGRYSYGGHTLLDALLRLLSSSDLCGPDRIAPQKARLE